MYPDKVDDGIKRAKIGIIAAAWIVYLLMGLAGKAIQDNEQIHADSPQTSYSEQTIGGAK